MTVTKDAIDATHSVLHITGGSDGNALSFADGTMSVAGGGGAAIVIQANNHTESFTFVPSLAAVGCEEVAPGLNPDYRCASTGAFGSNPAPVTKVTVDFLGGEDWMIGSAPFSVPLELNGGLGVDRLQSVPGPAIDVINGDDDNDQLRSLSTGDVINGGPGDDRLDCYPVNATLNGDAGKDTIFGSNGADVLSGGDDNDLIYGREGPDSLSGGKGDDYFEGGTGVDSYNGGDGVDTISYVDSPVGLTVTLGSGANDGPAPDNTENANTEGVLGSNSADTIIGDAGPNVIDGYGGDDLLQGGPGDDTLRGNEADVLEGGTGGDTFDGGTYATVRVSYAAAIAPVTVTFDGIANDGDPTANGGTGEKDNVLPDRTRGVIGTAFADTITGGTWDEYLDGAAGPDTITGGAGNDTLVGGPGASTADTLDGQGGANAVDYSARAEDLFVDLGNPTTDGAGGGAEGDVITNVRSVIGGSGNDVLRMAPITGSEGGPPPPRGLTGGGGNDELYGTEGVDSFDGGTGNDQVFGYGATDRLIGGPGNDELHGGASDDVIYGDRDKGRAYNSGENGTTDPDDGTDTLDGGDGGDTMVGGGGPDALDGGDGNDTLWGGAGADTVTGGAGYDFVDFQYRGAGIDATLGAGVGNDGNGIDGPAGARDTLAGDIEAVNGTGLADRIIGSAVDNVFLGFYGDDELRGLGGNDSINGGCCGYGGDGADIIDGGEGIDTVTYGQHGPGPVAITFDGVANDGIPGTGESASGAHDNVLAMETAIGSAGADTFIGTDADERFEGWSGADTINAGGGDDVIVSGDGADTIDAGAGNDAIGTGYYGPDLFALNAYDNARDTVQAGPGEDFIAASNDPGPGQNGNTLEGGPGADTITYQGDYRPATVSQDGVANDGIIGNNATDNVTGFETIVGTTGADTLLGGGGAVVLDGFAGHDTLTGSSAPEQLLGGPGDDAMLGGGGDDLLIGGDGKDAMTGEAGDDTVSYADRATTVSVTLDALANDGDPTVAGGGEKDKVDAETVVGGEGDDLLTGGGAADDLRGGPGADTIGGGAGSDVLDGGTGRDQLTSGAGSDRFEAVDGEADTLTCDTRVGKTVLVDATLDDFTTCADPATVGASAPGGGTPFETLADATSVPFNGGPQALPVVVPAPRAPRSASTLAGAVKLAKSVKLKRSSGAMTIGTAACDPSTRCTLSVALRAGKKSMGAGTVSGTGAVKAKAWLTAAGRRKLKSSRRLPLTIELTITEGASRATVSRSTTISLTGGR